LHRALRPRSSAIANRLISSATRPVCAFSQRSIPMRISQH
jgi:hypothetical protein